MKCPKCQFDNPEGSKFCGGCGQKSDLTCPECGANNPAENKFCNECGSDFKPVKEVPDKIAETVSPPVSPSKETMGTDIPAATGERKHVTVLFSDLTGYTAMSEKLDPEDVKEITSRIFSDISKIVGKYDGFIEKYAGDAVMAIFGVPKAHEDDPIRAVKAAREIHDLVDAISPEIESRIGRPISMHTGINTGLVVTGEVDLDRGTHGIAGDTINLASRLSNLAKPGEILVEVDTCRQIEGHFTCELTETTTVKGKSEPVRTHKVLSQRDKPVTIRRLSGVRADLVGRKVELAQLSEAVEYLRAGKGRIFSVNGDAGTGKSRLVEEFKATLDLAEIQWIEGHAYAYSRNIPYFALIDMLNRVFKIEEGDSSEKVRGKLESGIKQLVGDNENLAQYIGGLYSLFYQELEEVSPEFWKTRLQEAIQTILTALAKRAPTVFFLEDLHWADPSFVELLRKICLEMRQPAVVLCVYRPTFSLFTSHQLSSLGKVYHEIRLQNLSLSDAQEMLESLLKTESIPSELKRVVQSKAEGNPFYLEELVNTLIESDTLIRDDNSWKLIQPISDSDISSSLNALISDRIDRLEKETKRILQEAAVIGRVFFYEILKKVTELKQNIDQSLKGLEQLDLIRSRSLQPELEYMFKHALTQEIVYNGLLKKERKEIHEKIGSVMEQLFQDRLPEFYETLAFHYRQGHSIEKAADYLIKSGEKSVNRFSLDEAHQYYQQAYDLLSSRLNKTEEGKNLLIDLLEKWALVYYYYGKFRDLVTLFRAHEAVAESLEDKGRPGKFYAWLGMALWAAGKHRDSYRYLRKALKLGEEANNRGVIGYACTWLPLACIELGLMDEGIDYGERAKRIAEELPSDQYLYFKSRGDLGCLYYFRGDSGKALESGKEMIEYGEKHANIRSQAMGHAVVGWGYLASGDFESAINSLYRVEQIALDPFYATVWSIFRAFAHIFAGQLEEVAPALRRGEKCFEAGMDYQEAYLKLGWGLFGVTRGRFAEGINLLHEARQIALRDHLKCTQALSEYILGRVYLGMALGEGDVSFSTMLKNITFLLKTIPFAARRAETHLRKASELYREIGAKGTLASALLDLGNLHKAKKRIEQAKEHIAEAARLFEECEAEDYLSQAKEAIESL